jgi:two-component system CitB family sensor kinase
VRLQNKLIVLISSLLFLVMIMAGFIFYDIESNSLKEQIGIRAVTVAETVAAIPEIREAFYQPEPWKTIDPIVEKIRSETGAEFIVVGNREGIRYSHPHPEEIGKKMVGGDNGPVLQGKTIISEAVGSLGPSLRGKAPIFDQQGQVIGVVSVGFLQDDIKEKIAPYQHKIIIYIVIVLLIGIIGALLIARNIKHSIFGLEPKEIAHLYREKEAILESIREGIVAVNGEGIITMANRTAVKILGFSEVSDITGRNILELLPASRLLEIVRTGIAEYDQEIVIGDEVFVFSCLPILDHESNVIGAVASFRNKSELYRLTEELTQVKRYTEALRAQTHEFSNKLYMIYGLIQLGSYKEALELITRETDIHQNLVQFIMKEIPDPLIGGLLIGKFNRAQELKVHFEVDPESTFSDVPESLNRNLLVTIIGNLIDNAFDAVLSLDSDSKQVKVFLTDLGNDLIIEVEDNGIGIQEEYADKIFELGFSTKEEKNRGFGLALVKQAVEQLNGHISFTQPSTGGTIFTVAIPKRSDKSV